MEGDRFCAFDGEQQMLTQQLRELETEGLIHRQVYAEVPPRVEYSLTEYGKTLNPVLEMMCRWGAEHMNQVEERKTVAPENN
jgi:DNA-binding HxlR family transcriptional regulator